ncbi:MAG: dephospho-CoA kinase [Planctomycetota bacterium]|nr:dephospho-CoA kinase [Planctomycetota bacterium]
MNKKLPIIGIAGGIGSGKSTVASLLAELGCVIANADTNADTVLQREDVIAEIVSWWGSQLLDERGQINRSALGEIVFVDVQKRERLEQLIHPLVRLIQTEQFDGAPEGTIALVIDAPLLFETGLDLLCDAIIFVDTPREIRLKRVLETRGWDANELGIREAAQLPLDTKRNKADYVVTNGDELQAVKRQIENVFADIQSKQFNKN